MAKYRLLAARATDFKLRGEIPFSNMTFSNVLNDAGTISVTIPLLSADIVPAGYVTPAQTTLWVERDGVLVWGGIVWTTNVDLISETIQVSGEGFFSYYKHRINGINFDTGAIVPGIPEGDITYIMWQFLRTLTEDMTAGGTIVDPAWGYPYAPISGVPPIDTSGWYSEAAAGGFGWNVRNKWPVEEYKTHADIIKSMCAGEYTSTTNADGTNHNCDFAIIPAWDTVNNKPSVRWAFWDNKRGYTINTPLTMDGGVTSLGITYDASDQANKAYVLGTSGELPPRASYARGREGNAIFMEKTFSENLDSDALCLLYAKKASKVFNANHVIPEIELRGDNPVWDWTYYDVGDTFPIDVTAGFVDLDATWRIVEKVTTVSDSGTETVRISVADDLLF